MSAPVLLIAFNRPERLRRLIESLRPHEPQTVRIAIDGPRGHIEGDAEAVSETAAVARSVDWTGDVVVHQHTVNLGITEAIPWAVSWALQEFPEVIIIEDDVTVGDQFLDFASEALKLWRDDPSVFAVSGYNLVPPTHLSSPDLPARYSQLSHSYAWATWRRSWSAYDPEMKWFSEQSLTQLGASLGSRIAALRWKQYASHVRRRRVTTWDYQWVMSIWSRSGRVVMPNRNLIEYHGLTEGTHTFRNRSWSELPIEIIDLALLKSVVSTSSDTSVDRTADNYVQVQGHRSSFAGVCVGLAEAVALELRKIWRRRKSEA